MLLIRHRCNAISDLQQLTEPDLGVEIDLRSNVEKDGSIHLAHDPWTEGDGFEPWLQEFKSRRLRGPIILNTKEDGLEARVLELLKKFDIENFFFLDTAFPTLVKWSQTMGESRFALRLSSFEFGDYLDRFVGTAQWLWVDCFDGVPLDIEMLSHWTEKFKCCLVSPELQGKVLADHIQSFSSLASYVDAICTKNPSLWRGSLKL